MLVTDGDNEIGQVMVLYIWSEFSSLACIRIMNVSNSVLLSCFETLLSDLLLLPQMIILQLIVKRLRVKALVKDKRVAMEAFGAYVEVKSVLLTNYSLVSRLIHFAVEIWYTKLGLKSLAGDPKEKIFLKKALRGVRAVICPVVRTSPTSCFTSSMHLLI